MPRSKMNDSGCNNTCITICIAYNNNNQGLITKVQSLMSNLEPVFSYKNSRGKFYALDFRCRGHRVRVRGFVSSKEAATIAETIRIKILTDSYDPSELRNSRSNNKVTYNDVFIRCLRTSKAKQSTLTKLEGEYSAQIEERFSARKINSITGREISVFLNEKLEILSSGYVRNLYSNFLWVFKKANDLRIINEIPEFAAPKVKASRKRAFLKMEECKSLLVKAYSQPEVYWSEITHAIHFLILTGMRIGELRALRASDIDVEKGTILIERRLYNGVIDDPKNGKKQYIPLHPQLVEVFQRQKKISEEIRKSKGSDREELFLSRRSGNPLSHNGIANKVKALAVEVLGSDEGITSHCFRRSLSQHLIESGLDITSVSSMLRNTKQVMLKSYTQSNLSKLAEDFSSLEMTGSIN